MVILQQEIRRIHSKLRATLEETETALWCLEKSFDSLANVTLHNSRCYFQSHLETILILSAIKYYFQFISYFIFKIIS